MSGECLFEGDDSIDDEDSQDISDMIAAIFQEHVRDVWNLEYLDQLSAHYLQLGLVRWATHTYITTLMLYIPVYTTCKMHGYIHIHTYIQIIIHMYMLYGL